MIEKYLNEQKLNGIGDKTLRTNKLVLKHADEWKLLDEWKKDDVTKYFLQLDDLKQSTIESYKGIVKKYFIWAGKEDIVKHLKPRMFKNELKREDILDVEDIEKLIISTESTMYKAMIAFLFESGCRIREALAISISDIVETDKGMIVSVQTTKTGNNVRRILCTYSGQYIRNHITYCALKKEDKLFKISAGQSWEYLSNLGKKAGIEKPVTPHKFRHSQATDMVRRGYNESIIRKKLGWSPTSNMIERYIHLSDDDVINATAEKNGSTIEKKPLKNLQEAEKMTLVDAAAQFSKLVEENEQLKEMLQSQNDDIGSIKYEHQKDIEGLLAEMDKMKREQVAFYQVLKQKGKIK